MAVVSLKGDDDAVPMHGYNFTQRSLPELRRMFSNFFFSCLSVDIKKVIKNHYTEVDLKLCLSF